MSRDMAPFDGWSRPWNRADRPAARPVPLGVVMARKRLIAWQLKLGEF